MARAKLSDAISQHGILPFIGIYDVFSASIAAKYYDGLFISGFSFAASHYGLPDIGFNTWSDVIEFVRRVRSILPDKLIIVDIDDGFGDAQIACHVVRLLESAGADGFVMEDQQRPRRCGHVAGKQIMELDKFLDKLNEVLSARRDCFVVARTDSSAPEDIRRRCKAFAAAGADAILADGLTDLSILRRLSDDTGLPVVFNQIAGGKSPPCSLPDLKAYGVSVVLYSTPALFAAQQAITRSLERLQEADGLLQCDGAGAVRLDTCNDLLNDNLSRLGR